MKIAYEVCDRCGEKLSWPHFTLTRLKAFIFLGERKIELCGACGKKFNLFMESEKDDEWSTETIDNLKAKLDAKAAESETLKNSLFKSENDSKYWQSEHAKKREEITRLNQENETYSRDYRTHARIIEEQTGRIKKLYAEIEAMTVTGDGSGKSLPPIAESLVVQILEAEPEKRERTLKKPRASTPVEPEGEEIRMTLQQLIDTQAAPVKSTPPPEPEPIAEAIPEPEPQPTPVFDNTAVKETTTEEVTPVVKTKKAMKKAPTAFTPEQITRYSKMILDKEPRKVVLTAMMGEAGINEGLAFNRYYALRDKLQKQKITDSVQAHTDNTVTVIKLDENPKPLPRSIQAELDAMPIYDTIKDFKNAVCENELLKGYSIAELKEPYRSHRPDQVKW